VAWFPEALSRIATHPNGRTWDGAAGRLLYLFTLDTARLAANLLAAWPARRAARLHAGQILRTE
jgi:hypothetical protein